MNEYWRLSVELSRPINSICQDWGASEYPLQRQMLKSIATSTLQRDANEKQFTER